MKSTYFSFVFLERKKINILYLFILSCLLLPFGMNGQIKGVVTESSGQPLAGVNIIIKGSTRGVTSDSDGKYSIEAKKGESLEFSFIGYETQNIVVSKSTTINVKMNESSVMLQDVVAIGYGSLKSSQVSNSITKVTDKDIADRPATRIDQAIQGKIAGVSVREISGSPGKGLSVSVRGIGSINYSSSPLYVVDGFPLTDINNLNPEDIESIEVLKDAASAAIYGSRGSNGVIIVTTKHGKKVSQLLHLMYHTTFKNDSAKWEF